MSCADRRVAAIDPSTGAVTGLTTPLPARAAWPEAVTPCALPESERLNLRPDDAKNGLGQLVLALVKLLHELLERQAIRRIDAGSLTDTEIERLGVTLMKQAEEIDRLRQAFNLEDADLDIDLGPLGSLV